MRKRQKDGKESRKIEFCYMFAMFCFLQQKKRVLFDEKGTLTFNVIEIINQTYSILPKYYHFYQYLTIL